MDPLLIQTDWEADLYGVSSPESDSYSSAVEGHFAHSDYGSSPPLALGNPDFDTMDSNEYDPIDSELFSPFLPTHNIPNQNNPPAIDEDKYGPIDPTLFLPVYRSGDPTKIAQQQLPANENNDCIFLSDDDSDGPDSSTPKGRPQVYNPKSSFDTVSMFDFDALGSSSPSKPTPDATPQSQLHSAMLSSSNWDHVKHVRSWRTEGLTSDTIHSVRRTILDGVGIHPKPWQVSAIIDAAKLKRDVMVSAGTGSGKSLVFQVLPLIIIGALILVISPTIALMSDQVSTI